MEDEPEAAAHLAGRHEMLLRPPEAEWPDWSGYLRRAFDALRDDRPMTDFGNIGHIYWRAINDYAARHGIDGEDFHHFERFLRAMDDVFLEHVAEVRKAKEEAEKRKRNS